METVLGLLDRAAPMKVLLRAARRHGTPKPLPVRGRADYWFCSNNHVLLGVIVDLFACCSDCKSINVRYFGFCRDKLRGRSN